MKTRIQIPVSRFLKRRNSLYHYKQILKIQMKKVKSKQRNVKFSYCPSPVTIDKSSEWGEGNIQHFPNGVFFKHNEEDVITHGVQPNVDHTAPIGWKKQNNGLYEKSPIWIIEEVEAGRERSLLTLDGSFNYDIEEKSFLVCQDKNGKKALNDSWIVKGKDLCKNYYFESC